MNSVVLLIPLSLLLIVGAGIALFWGIDHGQFEDMEAGSLLPVVDAEPSRMEAPPAEEPPQSSDTTRGSQ